MMRGTFLYLALALLAVLWVGQPAPDVTAAQESALPFEPDAGDPLVGAGGGAYSPTYSDGVIMAGGGAVDVQWTAATYAGEDFKKWQLRRDTVPGTGETSVFESAQTSPLIHRDTVPVPGARHRYTIWHDECWWVPPWPYTKVCGWRKKAEWEVNTSALRGWVTSDLTVAPGAYTGWLIVNPGVELAMRPGTTINGSSYFYGGGMEMDGVTFAQTQIRFGNQADGSSGSGGVRGCTFLGESSIRLLNTSQGIDVANNTSQGSVLLVSLYGASSAEITDNTGVLSVSLDDTASATVAGSTLTGISLAGANNLTAERNTMSDGVFVWGAGSTAEVRRNTIITDDLTHVGEEGHGIIARTGTQVTAEDNKLVNTNPDEYGTMVIQAEGDAVLVARRNLVVGAIGVFDDVDATVTDNVITKLGLAVSATGAREITGNTIGSSNPDNPTRHATFYKTAPAAALITNNCFRNLSLWVNVEGPRSGYLNLRGNYWGAPSGPKTSANPGGTGVPLGGVYYALWDPFDRVGAMCHDEPPPPPVVVASIEVTADPDRLAPNGTDSAWITALARDAAGGPAAGAEIVFTAPSMLGRWAGADRCTTSADGRCRVQYVAPTPQEAAYGPDEVVLSGSGGGQMDQVRIELLYLSVIEVFPPRDRHNVDLVALSLEAVFDREIDFASINERTFRVTSIDHYAGGVPCEYRRGLPVNSIACDLRLANPATDPYAQLGLALTGQILGGVNGVRTADGRFMKANYTWRIFTTPVLEPQILFDQVTEEPVWMGSKPAVVRVDAGLSEESELDWVDADVTLRYPPDAATYARVSHRFYRTLGTARLEARLKGNTANFLSSAGEVPIVGPDMVGTHTAHVTVEPSDQLLHLSIDPRRYTVHASVEVRPLGGDYARLLVASYPMVPTDYPLHEFPYPWQVGQVIAAAGTSAAVTGARHYAEKWTPLWDIAQTVGTRGWHVWAPLVPNPKNDGAWYLARLVRHADWQTVPLVPSGVYVLMLAPWEWMRVVNAGLPTYHGPSHHVCLTTADAPAENNPAATLAWCIGHVHGLADAGGPAGYTLRSYDQERDRLVDSAIPETDYRMPVMGFDRSFWQAGLANLWMDTAGYGALLDQMSGSVAAAAAAIPLAGAITVGGEVLRPAAGTETGLLDVAELPARGEFPAPGGSGEYRLRLLGMGGAILSEHAFTPEFFSLGEGRDYASFLFNLPAPAGLRSVVLARGTVVLSTLAASASAPAVTIQTPLAGSYSGAITARWIGSDPDAGTALHYTVLYSSNDGATWQPVTLYTAEQQLMLDTAQYANCTQCRVKVIATDGFYSAEAVSARFTAANPPQVALTWPPNGATAAGMLTEVSAIFRDAMNGSTITGSSFTLIDAVGQPITGAVAYDAKVSQAKLVPAAPLAYGATYTARLAGAIKDAGGRPLGADYVWRFTVERNPITRMYLPLLLRM